MARFAVSWYTGLLHVLASSHATVTKHTSPGRRGISSSEVKHVWLCTDSEQSTKAQTFPCLDGLELEVNLYSDPLPLTHAERPSINKQGSVQQSAIRFLKRHLYHIFDKTQFK